MKDRVKDNGEVFTPVYLVKNMLDFVGYTGNIAKKHIIDNSCGDGAFLTEVVERYCQNVTDKRALKDDLEQFIHGIDIDYKNVKICVKKMDKVAEKYGLRSVKWDIINANALEVSEYDKKMDYVVGNPPYVRIHNLKENHKIVRQLSLSNSGMTDLYIAFYEIGFNMLKKDGKMCIITPSSFLTSKSGCKLRNYIARNRNLQKVIDLGHFNPFENMATYTFISMFDKSMKTDYVDYYIYDGDQKLPIFVDKLAYTDFYADDRMFFGTSSDLQLLNHMNEHAKSADKDVVEVKNGFATLADTIFIGDIGIKDEIVIDTIKASTGKWTKSIFPYNKQAKPLSEQEIAEKHKAVYDYLVIEKDKLTKRSILNKNEWYLFGRTQAIGDVNKPKLAINTIIKDVGSIKINEVPAGMGVYSGLYILYNGDYDTIRRILLSEDFVRYVKSLRKYKSGGYFTFSSKDLKNYLIYGILKGGAFTGNKEHYDKQGVLEANQQLFSGVS
jgi:adenine-specific DNA-methyltransferase